MRAQYLCDFARQVLPDAEYMTFRKAVFRWDAGYPSQARSLAAYARHAKGKG